MEAKEMSTREVLATNPLYGSLWKVRNPSCHGPIARRERQSCTDWINSHLAGCGERGITNLERALADGLTLCKLTEILTCQKPDWPHPRPALLPHRLDNTRCSLGMLGRVGVDVMGIHAEDVVNADPKTALALCCALQSRFQAHHQPPTPVLCPSNGTSSPPSHLNQELLSAPCSLLSSRSTPTATRDSTVGSRLYSFQRGPQPIPFESSLSRHAAAFVSMATKDDMALFIWIEHLLGVRVTHYSQLCDGIMLCSLVNQLCPGNITREQVLSRSPSQRMALAAAVAHRILGAPPLHDEGSPVVGWEEIKRYLMALRLSHEEAFKSGLHGYFRCSQDNEDRATGKPARSMVQETSNR